jgi:predicted DNA repair protein MutK
MSAGLLALLDDVAVLAKIAARSLDDAVGHAAKASTKAAGIVIDDTAVTPRYVVGFAADRELPIVARIAWGSLKNKVLFLLPAALALSWFAPWAITPLLMAGGAFLCFEGYEKAHEWLSGAEPSIPSPPVGGEMEHGHLDTVPSPLVGEGQGGGESQISQSANTLEDTKVAGAIRTDFILSAEIMAISLAAVAGTSFWVKALSLGVVALLVTGGVYGLVALIVKADDFGVALVRRDRPVSRDIGRLLVVGMPKLLAGLSVLGTLAMLWVGGGIILHGLAQYGLAAPEHAIEVLSHTIRMAIPYVGGILGWLASAACAGALGLVVGWVVERGVAATGKGH